MFSTNFGNLKSNLKIVSCKMFYFGSLKFVFWERVKLVLEKSESVRFPLGFGFKLNNIKVLKNKNKQSDISQI